LFTGAVFQVDAFDQAPELTATAWEKAWFPKAKGKSKTETISKIWLRGDNCFFVGMGEDTKNERRQIEVGIMIN